MLVFNDDVTTGFSKTSLEPISTLTFKGHGDKRNTCNNCDKRNSRHTCSNKTHDGNHDQIHDNASTTRIDPQNKPLENVPILNIKNQKMSHKYNKQNLVYNYSSVILTDAMLDVLNGGLNFAILPLKLELSQVDYRRFERSSIWHEFWFGRENEEYKKDNIYKPKKNNIPKNYTVPSE